MPEAHVRKKGLEWICRNDTNNVAMHMKCSEIVVSQHQSIVSFAENYPSHERWEWPVQRMGAPEVLSEGRRAEKAEEDPIALARR